MTTIYNVAKEANVSIATVSRVFNDGSGFSEATKQKVKKAADKLDYTPHLGARSLMSKRTNTIGIVLSEMHGEFFSELIQSLDIAARRQNLHLLVSSSHDNETDMTTALSAMNGKIDGMIVMSPIISPDIFEKHVPKNIPLVVLNGNQQQKPSLTVNLDNYTGALKMTEHLIEEGHRRITLIEGPKNNLDAEQRKLGYLDAMSKTTSDYLSEIIEGNFTEESGYEAGKKIISSRKRPHAVFALNDAMAIGCLCAFNEHNISVPQDIALAGFDDIQFSRYMRPSLSTVHVPIAEMGSKSLEILMDLLEDKENKLHFKGYMFSPSLVIRDSSKRSIK